MFQTVYFTLALVRLNVNSNIIFNLIYGEFVGGSLNDESYCSPHSHIISGDYNYPIISSIASP